MTQMSLLNFGEHTSMHAVLDRLQSSFQALERARRGFENAFRSDMELDVFLPPNDEVQQLPHNEQRERILRSLCQLWYDDEAYTLVSGLACVSERTVAAANEFNLTKDEFKTAIQAVRKASWFKSYQKSKNTSEVIAKLMAKERQRDPALRFALNSQRLSRLKFEYVYRTLRVLPSSTESVSWSWQNQHSAIKPISYHDACELASGLSCESSRHYALERLSDITDGYLAFVKPKKRQLRANINYFVNDQRLRKSVPISGVVLYPSSRLPNRIKWANEQVQPRLGRCDRRVDAEPYIKSLYLHRYLPGQGPRALAKAV